MVNDLYGWFEDESEHIAYDPPHNAPCPYCGNPMTTDDVRTHSFVNADGASRSYFYRTHRTCDDAASDGDKHAILGAVIERITVCEGERP